MKQFVQKTFDIPVLKGISVKNIEEHQNCTLILALDMWEHSYVADYQPSGKKAYVDDFFTNLNWDMIEMNLSHLSTYTNTPT